MIQDRARRRYWQAGLLAFVISPLAFLALPLGETLSVREQVVALLAVQAAMILGTLVLVRLRSRRLDFPFDLRPGADRRGSQRMPRRIDQFLD
jgi:uncharacterized membrane protein YhhN